MPLGLQFQGGKGQRLDTYPCLELLPTLKRENSLSPAFPTELGPLELQTAVLQLQGLSCRLVCSTLESL